MRSIRNTFLAFAATLLPLLAFASAQHKPPVMRLGDDVRPLEYELAMRVDPAARSAPGHVEIEVELKRPLDFFWMNAAKLSIRKAEIMSRSGWQAARVVAGGERFVGLQFAKPVPKGRARISIDYVAQVSSLDTAGIFRQQDLGEWYAFTQFESDYARSAFPCFDEPQWKTPWTLTLDVRKGHVAVSNTPVTSERELPDGFKEVKFAKTRPLPTYLVAFAAGPFDVVDGGTAGAKKTALRYIVPKGRGVNVRFAKESTPKLLALLEDYFGMPYPFEKLDSVAIPVTVGFGAMENPGMITYKSSLMVERPGIDDRHMQQMWAATSAHEMAHQWFGDLVTMKWWDDIWLNESFATWMERKIVPSWRPDWESDSDRNEERAEAFEVDRLSAARQVRQPVNTPADLANAFDRITYQKGGAVLSMFESWLGEEAFRKGVQGYLKEHEFGSATALDFFDAISKTDPAVAQAFSGFVMQPGLPMVDIALDCNAGPPAVTLRQSRFLPAQGDAPPAQRWSLPVCLRYEGSDETSCTMLREPQQRVVLAKAAQCPAWVLPNPGGAGYWLWRLDDRMQRALSNAPLKREEAMALILDETMLARSAALPVDRVLDLAGRMAASGSPEQVRAAVGAVEDVNVVLYGTPARAQLPAWVREHFGAQAAQLGWVPRAGETDAVLKLRNDLLPLVADAGEDAALKSQARSLALAWLGGDRRVLGATYRAVLLTAARDADADVYEAFVAAARKATDVATREDVYEALGRVRDPALRRRVFNDALSGGADLRESERAFRAAGDEPASSEALLDFVRGHMAEFRRRLPEESFERMPRWHGEICTAAGRDAVKATYQASRVRGIQRNLAQALETIDICVRNRAMQTAAH